jgi:hypothetical protein
LKIDHGLPANTVSQRRQYPVGVRIEDFSELIRKR